MIWFTLGHKPEIWTALLTNYKMQPVAKTLKSEGCISLSQESDVNNIEINHPAFAAAGFGFTFPLYCKSPHTHARQYPADKHSWSPIHR